MQDAVPETVFGIVIFYDVIKSTVLQKINGGGNVFLSGDDNDTDVWIKFLDFPEYFGTVAIG